MQQQIDVSRCNQVQQPEWLIDWIFTLQKLQIWGQGVSVIGSWWEALFQLTSGGHLTQKKEKKGDKLAPYALSLSLFFLIRALTPLPWNLVCDPIAFSSPNSRCYFIEGLEFQSVNWCGVEVTQLLLHFAHSFLCPLCAQSCATCCEVEERADTLHGWSRVAANVTHFASIEIENLALTSAQHLGVLKVHSF